MVSAKVTFLLVVILFVAPAMAAGQGTRTIIDTGFYNAELMKSALPIQEKAWVNGTYTSTNAENGNISIDARGLWLTSNLTITTLTGKYGWNPANLTGGAIKNGLKYSNSIASVEYDTWDTYLKETIILNSPVSVISWKLNFSTSNKIAIDAGDNYLISSPDLNDWQIKLGKPSVIDNLRVKRGLKFTYNAGTKTLTLIQDFAGLQYPLTIDPSYTVDSGGDVGGVATMRINQSGYPWIAYTDITNRKIKVASNNSGVWSTTTLPSYTRSDYGYIWLGFDFGINDLPIVSYENASGASSGVGTNITYWKSGTWIPSNIYEGPVIISSDSYRGATIRNGNTLYVFYPIIGVQFPKNVSWTDMSLGDPTTWTNKTMVSLNTVRHFGVHLNKTGYINFVAKNGSGLIFNTFDTSTNTITDLRTIGEADPLNAFQMISVLNQSVNDLPMAVYVNKTILLNFTYEDPASSKWKYETITSNGSMKYAWPSIARNSSGFIFVPYQEGDINTFGWLNLAIRNPNTNTWSNRTIDSSTSPFLGKWNSIAIDSQDGIHIAYYDVTNANLMYYYEPLASAGGAAPFVFFTATPLGGVRNSTRAIVDQSSNTPTSVSLYGAGTNPCIGSNVSFSPGGAVNIFPLNYSWCGVCEIASNAQGTSTNCTNLYVSQPWVV